MKEITKQYHKMIREVGKYLDHKVLKKDNKVLYQEEGSTIEIAELGKKFGTGYDEEGNLILADWMKNLPPKDKEYVTEFLLMRESFREYLKHDIDTQNPYERFTDIILQILALLWFCEKKEIPLNSLPVIIIKRRADMYKEDILILESQFWVFFYTKLYQQKLTASKLYYVLIRRVEDAITEKKAIEELAMDLQYWMKVHLPDE
ncbi:MAG: hypothetical protein FK732_10915, partial [Asgard group archaeon]|nr:hypothetical protein [Asgard group archaeon]